MASELRVNTLKDASGNNSIATSFVAQGSAKAFFTYEKAANTLRKSLNTSSITDTNTGRFSYNATSAFSDTFSSFVSQGGNILRESAGTGLSQNTDFSNRSTTVITMNGMNTNGTAVDLSICVAGFGDLA